MAPLMAGVFAKRGVDALVFRGDDGLDELTTSTTSRVWSVSGGVVTEETFDPARLGIAPAAAGALTGGDADTNARIIERVLAGESGPQRDVVLLNAGAALMVAGLVDSVQSGLGRAAEAIDRGAARATLDRLKAVSVEEAGAA
jgi:anthranilate phosphoribosyltransferase